MKNTRNVILAVLAAIISPLAMHAQTAFTNWAYPIQSLKNFTPTEVIAIQGIPPGRYMVEAKATLLNDDGDFQNGSCSLVATDLSFPMNTPAVLDKTSARLNHWCSGAFCGSVQNENAPGQSIALQGTFCSNKNANHYFQIEVDCSTYNGWAQEAVITVTSIPTVNVTGGNTPTSSEGKFNSCVNQVVQ